MTHRNEYKTWLYFSQLTSSSGNCALIQFSHHAAATSPDEDEEVELPFTLLPPVEVPGAGSESVLVEELCLASVHVGGAADISGRWTKREKR